MDRSEVYELVKPEYHPHRVWRCKWCGKTYEPVKGSYMKIEDVSLEHLEKYLYHDGLCPKSPEIGERRTEQDRTKIITTLFERASHLLSQDLNGVRSAIKYFEAMTLPDAELPKSFFDPKRGYTKGDERAPFMSEAFLYNLLGKEEARTVLAVWNKLKVAAGMEP